MSVASHIAGESLQQLFNNFDEKLYDQAKKNQYHIAEISKLLFPSFAPNPVAVKCVLNSIGIIGPTVRLPLTGLSALEKEEVIAGVKKYL